jgi:hypothetical protein
VTYRKPTYWLNTLKSDIQKANLLAKHFENVFKPYPSEMTEAEDRKIRLALTYPTIQSNHSR